MCYTFRNKQQLIYRGRPSPSGELVRNLRSILYKVQGGSIDEAVNEIAEMFGYDKLDAIMKLLENRDDMIVEVCLFVWRNYMMKC